MSVAHDHAILSDSSQSKVLLFGQSAGASNTFVIGTLPQASTLINAGIAESGGGNTYPSSATQQTLGTKYASTLNCTDAACLRSKTTAELNSTFSSVGSAAFGAFVDGETIPAQPADVGVQVPFIFGSSKSSLLTLVPNLTLSSLHGRDPPHPCRI